MNAPAVARDVLAALREEGGLLSGALVGCPTPPGAEGPVTLDPVAARLVEGLGSDRAFALVAVREGYLLHYGTPRLVDGADEGLALLAGDRLYALGLARLAAAADVSAVRELADLITRCAQAHAVDDRIAAEVAWEAAGARLAGRDGSLRRPTGRQCDTLPSPDPRSR